MDPNKILASGKDPLPNSFSSLKIDFRDYIHSPIQRNEIRLFRGHSDNHGTLSGEVETFSLNSPDLPIFQALSYTWGASVYTSYINIGSKRLSVLDSLYPLLRYVLDDNSEAARTWWWIDSLCIDQKNSDEKALQVPLMGTIFRAAQQTLVWLGEEADDSTQAIEFLHWIEKEFRENRPSEEWLAKVVPRNGAYGKDWEAVEKLFCRPWWTRVWTVQEFVVPDKVVLFCGKSWISRTLLSRALCAIWSCCEKTLKYDNPWNRTRLIEWRKRFGNDEDTRILSSSLTATLAYLGHHEATDPRDRIYSLSGIVKDFELAGVPDYNQPVEILYSTVVKSFVERYHSLDIICFATLFRSDEAISNQSIPSWVPDWRVRATAMVGPVMVSQSAHGWIGNFRPLHSLHCTAAYSASLSLEARVKFSPDLRELTCQGFILDFIDGLAGLPFVRSSKFPRQSDNLVHSTTHISPSQHHLTLRETTRIMESIMRCLTLNRGDHYFNHSIPTCDFSQQFRNLLEMALSSNPALTFLFRSWFQSNRLLRVGEWDLETLSSKWIENGEGIRQNTSKIDHRGSFYSRLHDTVVKMSRRLVVTEEGLIGMAPRRARKNDLICVLYGCSVPIVLRNREDAGGDTYTFIGECYVDGFMNGESLTMAKDRDKQSFRIL